MRHDVTITWQWVSRYDFYVTYPISGKQNSTDSILVSILPYSRLRNSKMMKLFMYNSRVTYKVTVTDFRDQSFFV